MKTTPPFPAARRLASLPLAAALLFALAPARPGRAQDPARADAQMTNTPAPTYVIRGGRVVTVSGAEIENGTVVVSGGRISAVGSNVTAPAGAQEIDARGLAVYPGMIDVGTNMGLLEVSSVGATADTQELGEMNPNAAAYWSINPSSSHIAVTRVEGVTSVLSMPAGGTISGQAAFINLAGSSQREMAVVPTAALVVNFPAIGGGGGGFAASLLAQQGVTQDAITQRDRRVEELRRMLRDAEAYGRAQDAHARDPKSVPRPTSDLKLAALVPYARGERPVIFRAERERDIRAAVRFADERTRRPVVIGGGAALKPAEFLKQRDEPGTLDGVVDLPRPEVDGDDYPIG